MDWINTSLCLYLHDIKYVVYVLLIINHTFFFFLIDIAVIMLAVKYTVISVILISRYQM